MHQHEFAFILATHNQEPLLLAHLDILHFCSVPHDVVIVYSGDKTLPVPYVRSPRSDDYLKGAALAFTTGLIEARDYGYKRICYRNGDDWLFNQQLVAERLEVCKKEKVCGYNWFSCNTQNDIALNEVYVDMSLLTHANLNLDRATNDPERFALDLLGTRNFHRLTDREAPGGIGKKHEGDAGLQDSDNNRWFCKSWGLISAHDDTMRRDLYSRLRADISYADELEERQWFKAWLYNDIITYL